VTSIATGIVTVSLMEKAPTGVTKVVNQIVEHTVEKVIPASPNALTAKTASKLPTSTLRVVCEGRGLMFESVGFMCVLESPYYSRKEEPEEPPSFALRATVGREESEEPEDKRY
jgi:hypothetical protein